MTGRMVLLAVAALAISVRAVDAHDGHAHIVMGSVTAVETKHLELKTPSGEVLSIAITAKTKVVREKKKASLRDVQVGRRAVVDIGNGEDPLIAREIQVGVGAAVPGASAPVH
jgi:hypothetical protein